MLLGRAALLLHKPPEERKSSGCAASIEAETISQPYLMWVWGFFWFDSPPLVQKLLSDRDRLFQVSV